MDGSGLGQWWMEVVVVIIVSRVYNEMPGICSLVEKLKLLCK